MLNRQKIEQELKSHPKRYYTIKDLCVLCDIGETAVKKMMNRIIFWNDNYHKDFIIVQFKKRDIQGRMRTYTTERRVYYYEEKEDVV